MNDREFSISQVKIIGNNFASGKLSETRPLLTDMVDRYLQENVCEQSFKTLMRSSKIFIFFSVFMFLFL